VDDLRARARHHGFAVVLLLVLVSVSFQVAAPDADWSRLVDIALGAVILIVSAWAAQARHPLVRFATIIAALLALFALVVLVTTGEVPRGTAALVNVLLVAFAPVMIAAGVVRDLRASREVTLRALSGVLAIYLLVGMLFSFLEGAIGALGSDPFFTNDPGADRSDFLYFSYITLSTTGYGDLVPATDVGRMLAVAEALLGQIYLVTIVSLIVANMRPRRVEAGAP
jgi:Ion channel